MADTETEARAGALLRVTGSMQITYRPLTGKVLVLFTQKLPEVVDQREIQLHAKWAAIYKVVLMGMSRFVSHRNGKMGRNADGWGPRLGKHGSRQSWGGTASVRKRRN